MYFVMSLCVCVCVCVCVYLVAPQNLFPGSCFVMSFPDANVRMYTHVCIHKSIVLMSYDVCTRHWPFGGEGDKQKEFFFFFTATHVIHQAAQHVQCHVLLVQGSSETIKRCGRCYWQR